MMFVLGLGSSLGDRLANLKQAVAKISQIPDVQITQISPVYQSKALLPEDAQSDWDQPYLNMAILVQSSLSPQALIAHTKGLETQLGRKRRPRWSPRVIDIDLLLWGTNTLLADNLQIPHKGLLGRPFVLWPLADILPVNFVIPAQSQSLEELIAPFGSRFDAKAPLATVQIPQRVDTPSLVGVLNLTADSFSDGGEYLDVDRACAHCWQMVEAGAAVIDVGAESTSGHIWQQTHAGEVHQRSEWRRLEPFLTQWMSQVNSSSLKPKLSIDTRNHQTAQKALSLGVDWINDVSGFDDPNMIAVLKDASAQLVVMHHLGVPPSQDKVIDYAQDPVKTVYDWARVRLDHLLGQGICQDRLIFDVGIGFGKTSGQSLALIRCIQRFKSLGHR